jgi:tetratricopeptide (TPR) repeat protein
MKLNNADRARDSFMKVIAISARVAADDEYVVRSYYFLGYIAYIKGNYRDAIINFSKVLEINKDNPNVVYMLSILHLGLYQLDEARVYALRYLEKKPDDPLMHAVIGIILYMRNDLSAIDHLRIGTKAGSIDALVSKGLYNEMLRDDDNGEEILEKIIKIRPDIIAPHIALARISKRKNKTGQSFNEWLNSGILSYQNRLYIESLQCFTEALALNKGIPGLYYYLGKSHEEMGNISQAILNYRQAYTLKPESDLMLQIGYLYAVKQDYNTAFAIFDTIQAKEPTNSKSYFFRGLMYIWKEEYREAEIDIKKAISLNENTEPYYFYLAVALEKMKKIDEAAQSLEKAISSDPASGRSHNFLGYLYADNSINLERSIILIQRALELEPGNGAYIDSLGWIYYRQGNFKTALEHLHRAEIILEKSKTPDPVVYDHLGDAYDKLGNGTRAVQYWKKAFEMNDDRAIQEKIKRSRNNTDEQ